VAVAEKGQPVDLVVLQHAATIAHIELERRRTAAMARLHTGARLLQQVNAGRIDSELAAAQLREYGKRAGSLRLPFLDL
jgi:galactose-1-phosphate uridylyltransferase